MTTLDQKLRKMMTEGREIGDECKGNYVTRPPVTNLEYCKVSILANCHYKVKGMCTYSTHMQEYLRKRRE